MSENNATILDRVRLVSSNDYQQRIPNAFIDGPENVQSNLLDPNNGQLFNEFVRNFAVLIGVQKAQLLNWSNPLSKFKTDAFKDGKSFHEYATNLIKPLQYNPDDTALVLRNNSLDVESYFYSVNRRLVYPVTVNSVQVRSAFNNVESGLNDYLTLMLETPWVSNQYDEYRFMIQTFAAANGNRPFYNVESTVVDAKNPTEIEVKRLSRLIRTYGEKLGVVPSGLYNGSGLPTTTKKSDLVLFITPELKASMDVEVLADAFNQDKTDFVNGLVIIDEFPWAGVHAALVDKNAIIAGDYLLTIQHFFNAATFTDNYYLHAQGGYAISALKNIILFSNTASTSVGTVTIDLESIDAHFENAAGETVTTAHPNGTVFLKVVATGDVDPDNVLFQVPGSYTVEITSPEDENITHRTFVNSAGKLVIPADTAVGTELTVKVTAAYRDPSAPLGTATTPHVVTKTLTIN